MSSSEESLSSHLVYWFLQTLNLKDMGEKKHHSAGTQKKGAAVFVQGIYIYSIYSSIHVWRDLYIARLLDLFDGKCIHYFPGLRFLVLVRSMEFLSFVFHCLKLPVSGMVIWLAKNINQIISTLWQVSTKQDISMKGWAHHHSSSLL